LIFRSRPDGLVSDAKGPGLFTLSTFQIET